MSDKIEEFRSSLQKYREGREKLNELLQARLERRRAFREGIAAKLGISLEAPNPDDSSVDKP